jgi:hypothetical protein
LHAQSNDQVDQRQIHSHAPIKPQIPSMVARQEEFNTSVNLLMSIKVGDLHHVQDRGSREILNPRLGDYLGLLPSRLHHLPLRHEHRIVLPISEVEVIDLERWDQSQLGSNCVYPLQEVLSDEHVLKVTWDIVMDNYTSQRRSVVRQDRRDLLCDSQIIVVFASFLNRGSARPSSGRGGCLQSSRR